MDKKDKGNVLETLDSNEQMVMVVHTKKQLRAELILGLLNDYHFRTMLSGELFVYDSKTGIWRSDGLPEAIIKARVQRVLGHANATTYEKETIISGIKDSTSIYPEFSNDIEFWSVPLNLICVQNGVLDIFSRKLVPHDSTYHFLQRIPVNYEENAREKGKDLIRIFLYEIASKGEDVLGHYEMVGYSLYRAYIFQIAFLFIGSGDNGKSTLNNIVNSLLGTENVSNISLQGLCANRFSSSNLIGKLANIYNDITAKELKNTGRFKMLTGGDPIDAEKKNIQKRFKFVNYAKLIFSCNEVPKASSDDTRAFWKRWIPVYFNNVFEKGNRDENLTVKLTRPEELSILLLDALDGLKRLFDNKVFSHGKNVEEARSELLLVSEPIKFFAEEMLEEHSESYEVKNSVYVQYKNLCREYNLPIKALNSFTRSLKQYLNVEPCQRKVMGKMTNCYCGIRFKDEGLRLVREEQGQKEKLSGQTTFR